MGIFYRLTCPECGYSVQFTDGINGFGDVKYYTDEHIQEVLAKDAIMHKIYYLVKKPSLHFVHKLYFCPNCNEFSENIYAYISSDNGTYLPEPTCNKCNHTATMYKDRMLDRVPCQKCFDEKKKIIYMNKESIGITD